jgi:hypothetical protein
VVFTWELLFVCFSFFPGARCDDRFDKTLLWRRLLLQWPLAWSMRRNFPMLPMLQGSMPAAATVERHNSVMSNILRKARNRLTGDSAAAIGLAMVNYRYG